MSQPTTSVKIDVASVTDRGLSEKRPLNEDSFLADAERRIFAVADGVGGAEAGEVASQTAIEVLDEAFRHHRPGEDIEDLMEIAIQRANSSIHQMSREHPKLSMMATTIVALHIDGHRATIGHVGDSRLYCFPSDGKSHRETEDHSVVEEEVRAGRMTAEQAAHHPSRNVISRALGAEASVEVDMKTIEVDDGTTFLLCSDGITRHISDDELRLIVDSLPTLEDSCAEMKRRCFERGAEDNLTAVLIRVGDRSTHIGGDSREDDEWDDEKTLLAERPGFVPASNAPFQTPLSSSPLPLQNSSDAVEAADETPTHSPAVSSTTPRLRIPTDSPAPVVRRKTSGANFSSAAVLLLLLGASAISFYGGMLYQGRSDTPEKSEIANSVMPAPTPISETAEARYERLRRQVDRAPAYEASRMAAETNDQPFNSPDPEFLYLYGRALLLSGKPQEAARAFEAVVAKINENMTPQNGQLKIEARLGTTAAHLRSNNFAGARSAAQALDDVIKAEGSEGTPIDESQSPQPSPPLR